MNKFDELTKEERDLLGCRVMVVVEEFYYNDSFTFEHGDEGTIVNWGHTGNPHIEFDEEPERSFAIPMRYLTCID